MFHGCHVHSRFLLRLKRLFLKGQRIAQYIPHAARRPDAQGGGMDLGGRAAIGNTKQRCAPIFKFARDRFLVAFDANENS